MMMNLNFSLPENEEQKSDLLTDSPAVSVKSEMENLKEIQDICPELLIEKHLKNEIESNNVSSDDSYFLIDEDDDFKKSDEGKYNEAKICEIENALSSQPIDIDKLKILAINKGGFIKDDLRQKAWPLLMHMKSKKNSEIPDMEVIKKHKEYNQVVLDVNRTLKRFPPGIEDQLRYVLMDQLTCLIVRILDQHPELHYYQGYHDVAITFLLVMGEGKGYELMERLSVTHLYEFMKPTMDRTVYYLTYLYPILKRINPSLHDYLIRADVGTIFCLPWLITWYAHTLPDYRDVVRLYDFLLATPYLMPMYIAVAIVIYREKEILEADCDMAMQHFVLSQT